MLNIWQIEHHKRKEVIKIKKFVFLYNGYETPTPEIMEAWGKWFASIADKVVDAGSPFGAGREITHSGTKELPLGMESVTGYSIINADNIDDAEEIAKDAPITTSVGVYEAVAM